VKERETRDRWERTHGRRRGIHGRSAQPIDSHLTTPVVLDHARPPLLAPMLKVHGEGCACHAATTDTGSAPSSAVDEAIDRR
jgi:hypothetical protein